MAALILRSSSRRSRALVATTHKWLLSHQLSHSTGPNLARSYATAPTGPTYASTAFLHQRLRPQRSQNSHGAKLNPDKGSASGLAAGRSFMRTQSGTGDSLQVSQQKNWQCIIFDKDGTLFDTRKTWHAWAECMGQHLTDACSQDACSTFFKHVGYDPETRAIAGNGLLAMRPWTEIYDAMAIILSSCSNQELEDCVASVGQWRRDFDMVEGQELLFDVADLFTQLRASGVKVAINTADDRLSTDGILAKYGLTDLVDIVLTSSEMPHPKPHQDSALFICSSLSVDPELTMVVGDTSADLLLGRNANLGLSVGVLSGACTKEELSRNSDIILKDARGVLQLINAPLDALEG